MFSSTGPTEYMFSPLNEEHTTGVRKCDDVIANYNDLHVVSDCITHAYGPIQEYMVSEHKFRLP